MRAVGSDLGDESVLVATWSLLRGANVRKIRRLRRTRNVDISPAVDGNRISGILAASTQIGGEHQRSLRTHFGDKCVPQTFPGAVESAPRLQSMADRKVLLLGLSCDVRVSSRIHRDGAGFVSG